MGVRADRLLHNLHYDVRIDSFQLQNHNPETLHKILDGFVSPHPYVEQVGHTMFPLDGTHILGDKLLE